jgi:hypothetical protein
MGSRVLSPTAFCRAERNSADHEADSSEQRDVDEQGVVASVVSRAANHKYYGGGEQADGASDKIEDSSNHDPPR